MPINTITVSQLNSYVKSLIENDTRLAFLNVSGEISNFKNHFASGHWYFTLKDKQASIRCVMFRTSASRVKFEVTDGLAVVIKGRVSIYEKDGQYQFYAEEMHPLGEGDLSLAFKQVKEKLEAEGLFDKNTKRPLVKYPKKIAVITSDTGAAVRDVFNILNTRYPCCEVIMCPCLVQGDMAARDMIKTLDRVYQLDGIDTVIIGRGGGSAEDLHCFNDEALARKIYESPFPVISAVGHETDFTICDFVADVRASTPSHAAELAVPDKNELISRLNSLTDLKLKSNIKLKYELSASRLEGLKNKFSKTVLENTLQKRQLDIDNLTDKMSDCVYSKVSNADIALVSSVARIDALSPLKIMSRGFSLVSKNGQIINSVGDIKKGDNINVSVGDGDIDCTVLSVQEK
ncbi:MAG: exodeoxyribonuclease VII large subunit [Clostridia bacterium]|nr:exodeoxyribonuclease VII large subunit [Clostridia bacterium]